MESLKPDIPFNEQLFEEGYRKLDVNGDDNIDFDDLYAIVLRDLNERGVLVLD